MATTEIPAPTDLPLSRPASTNPVRVYWQYAINVVLIHLLAILACCPGSLAGRESWPA